LEYYQERINRENGHLEATSLGNWVTITEFGKAMGVGSRQTRAILIEMDFLFISQATGEDKFSTRSRSCLRPWVIEMGWGRRNFPRKGYPFDVINEEAQEWIKARWFKTKERVEDLPSYATKAKVELAHFFARRSRNVENFLKIQVKWLLDHFPELTHSEMARILSVSQQIVSKKISDLDKSLKDAQPWQLHSGSTATALSSRAAYKAL
jgi:hypothetical protein